jgi:hypothetical protein
MFLKTNFYAIYMLYYRYNQPIYGGEKGSTGVVEALAAYRGSYRGS